MVPRFDVPASPGEFAGGTLEFNFTLGINKLPGLP
jgi:hypothetical protein